jgi:S-adenosylmethionine:diacylglycerol 3-amino-3-carboxypropyl transferase
LVYPRADSNLRLKQAVRRHRALSREGLLERLFERLFHGLVYTQIWEDPEVDLEALTLRPDSHVVAIASGGCNVLSYLTGDPARITALDLSRAHVALNRLKLVAASRLPSWEVFYRFFGAADDEANIAAYQRLIAPHLDPQTRLYWEGRSLQQLGRRRISIFARNAYRHGVLGRFIGLAHAICRAYGVNLRELLGARTLEEQRRFFDTVLAPLFDKKAVRWATGNRLSLYGLGIPPAQYEALAGGSDMRHVLRARLERLTCGFSLDDNYFAWQAFGGPTPRTARARCRLICGASISRRCAPASTDRYLLGDARDRAPSGRAGGLGVRHPPRSRRCHDLRSCLAVRRAGLLAHLRLLQPVDDAGLAGGARTRSGLAGAGRRVARRRFRRPGMPARMVPRRPAAVAEAFPCHTA